MFRFRSSWWIIGVLVFVLAFVGGCGGDEEDKPTDVSDTQPPTVDIHAPLDQSIIAAGQAIQVNVVAQDDQAVARVELYVDNSLIESRVAPEGSALTTKSEQFMWSAAIIGPHSLQARAYDALGKMGASRIVAVNVQMPGAATTAPLDTPSTEATSPPSGETPTSLPPTELVPTLTPESALVTANVNANVRAGPGTNYSVVGGLGVGQSALVTGRNADSSWWQISFQGGNAWIANSVVTANARAFDALVVSAPPPPPTNTPLPSTATPLPTATLGPSATPIPTTGFRADQTNLSAGQCTTLRWDFDNIKAIHIVLGVGYDEVGQPGHGTAQVCPSVTTTYKARVVKTNNSQETHEATVNVSGSGCGDPVITQFAPTTSDVASGSPFSIFWQVDCAKAVWYIKGDGFDQTVAGHGSKIDETITQDTVFKLKVEKNSGGYVYASFTVRVY